jgi:hypothetical protein
VEPKTSKTAIYAFGWTVEVETIKLVRENVQTNGDSAH